MRTRKGKFDVNKLVVGDIVRIRIKDMRLNAEITEINGDIFKLKVPARYGSERFMRVKRHRSELEDSNMIFQL